MLQSRIQAARADLSKRDKGFTLIELLVVVIIIGILSAIAIPVFLGQRQKAFDAGVQSDMKNFAIAAETTFTDALSYPAAAATFGTDGVAPIVTKNNGYRVFVDDSGVDAGYVIYGKNSGSAKLWVVSSYNGGAPSATTGGLPGSAPALGTVGIPATAILSAPVNFGLAAP
jgi:type IV pilus assembly protein PilA